MRDKLLMHTKHTGQYCRCCDRPRPKTGIRRREKQQWISDYLDELTPNPRRSTMNEYPQIKLAHGNYEVTDYIAGAHTVKDVTPLVNGDTITVKRGSEIIGDVIVRVVGYRESTAH